LTPVTPRDTLSAMDEQRLAAYLQQKMSRAKDVRVWNVARIAGGASRETWSFDASWRVDGGGETSRGFIIRRDPPASLLDGNNELEFQIYSAMAGGDIPVPPAHWLEREGAELERPFFVMGRVAGQTDARTLVISPEWRDVVPSVARQKAEILARIHRFDIDKLPALERPAAGLTPAEHEIARWERVMRRDTLEPQPVLELALSWLKRHVPPPPERLALVHADYRTGNFLYDRSGITGILDWEMAHAGDPVEDVGWVVMRSWRWAGDDRVGGLCSRDEFVRMYEDGGGAKVERDALAFWEVFSNVKFATLFLTGTKAVIGGRTPDALLAVTSFIQPGLEVELLELIR
jgi:aminoglycoside phosphotransferase (APT) family kinase protein